MRTFELRRTTPFVTYAAGDRAEARDAEELPHLDLADRLLGADRREHPDERLLDVLGELVDHAVGADLDALAVGERARLGVRADVEADDHRVRGRGEHDVVLGDRAHALVDHVHAHLGVLDLGELGDRGLDGADDVALEDEVQVLDRAFLELREERLERNAAASRAARAAPGGAARRARCAKSRAARSFSTTFATSPAGGGWSKPRISTGSPGVPP